MFILYADKNKLIVRQREPLTSGSVNVCPVQFEFSPDWHGLTKTAVFKAGATITSILLDDSNQCTIPWEVLFVFGRPLMAGVYGTYEGQVVLPTIWANLGTILEGVTLGVAGQPPTPGLYEQLLSGLAARADRLAYTPDGALGLYAGEKLLCSVPIYEDGGNMPIASESIVGGIKASDSVIVDEDGTAHAVVGTDNIASDEEVDAALNDIFGQRP